MSSATLPVAEPLPLASMDGLRDDIAEHFKPVTGYERHLVAISARAYERYEKALEMERRAFARTDPFEMLNKQPDLFKSITRYVADAERGWRKSLEEIRRAIRQRPKGQTVPPANKAAAHPVESGQQPPASPQSAPRATVRRE